MLMMKVTVVVPVFNPGAYIEPCIKSLLAQSMAPGDFEVIRPDWPLRPRLARVEIEPLADDRRRARPQLGRLDTTKDQFGVRLADGERTHAERTIGRITATVSAAFAARPVTSKGHTAKMVLLGPSAAPTSSSNQGQFERRALF